MGMGPKVTIPVVDLSVSPHRAAARRQAHAHRHRRSVGGAGQQRLRREARGMAAHAAQEERGGRAGHPEPQRDRQFASSRRHSGVVSDQALPAQRRGEEHPQTRELYRQFGLSDRQIDIIAEATPKRDYYYVSPLGRRLFQFALGPAALAFIGAGSKDDVLTARRMIDQHGERWTRRMASRARLARLGRLSRQTQRHVETPTDAILSVNGIPAVPHQRKSPSEGDTSMKSKQILRVLDLPFRPQLFACWLRLRFLRTLSSAARDDRLRPDRCIARQLQQLQQETATVTNLAQQLQYMIKNTTGGGAGVWQSNQNLLANLGGLITSRKDSRTPFRASRSSSSSSIPATTCLDTPACKVRRRASTPRSIRSTARSLGAGAGPELPGRAGHAAEP